MKIGYPCSNLSIGCSGARTFRLASYSPEKLIEVIEANLDCLGQMLRWNAEHGILFFRISSTTVPFASHPVMSFDWQRHFSDRFAWLGDLIRQHGMRITRDADQCPSRPIHPDQFTKARGG